MSFPTPMNCAGCPCLWRLLKSSPRARQSLSNFPMGVRKWLESENPAGFQNVQTEENLHE